VQEDKTGKDWKELKGLLGIHPLDNRYTLINRIIKQEKQKSYEEGYKECGKDVIEVLEEINRNIGKMDEEYFGK
jgi:intergrase/recombinase